MTTRPIAPGSTLLVDLDGVVADQLPRLCTYLAEAYDHEVPPEAIDDWTYPVPGFDGHIGDVIRELMAERAEWFFGGMDPVPGVRDALDAIGDEYHVEIATHRIPETHDVSKAWLDDLDIPYDDFHHEVPPNKGAVPGDALIDDYHGNVANALDAGKTGFLMRRPYSDPSACDGAHVVENWDDVRAIFDV